MTLENLQSSSERSDMKQCLGIFCFFLISCTTLSTNPTHTLQSSLLSSKSRAALSSAWPELMKADVILIGELHDNPHHHELQADLIKSLANAKRLDAVLFEQLDTEQAPALAGLELKDLDRIPELLSWSNSGWPDFALYRPVFKEALEAQIPIIAANFPRSLTKKIYQEGYPVVFNAAEVESLGLHIDLEREALRSLREAIYEGHCRLIPDAHLHSMIQIQRARDGMMALQLRRSPQQGTSVYIVGSGHARRDYGIPKYLKNLYPNLKIYSIGLVEEQQEPTQTNPSPYDLTLVTKAAQREDPCLALEKKLKS